VIRARVPHEPTAMVARALGRSLSSTYQRAHVLGAQKSAAYLASAEAGRLGHGQGGATRFRPGNVPANKGLRRPGWGPGRMKATQFKPGVRQGVAAKNWRPVGTILSDSEGYQRIKVREARPGEPYGFGNVRVWPLLQRHVWAEAYGPIPPGHSVVFRDGNRRHCALENLELVTRAELMRRNSIHNLPPELKETVQLLGRVKRQIRKRGRDATEQDHRPA